MAKVSIIDSRHTNLEVALEGLQVGVGEYDKIVFQFSQGGTTILSYTYDWNTGTGTNLYFTFSNENYLGNNWFAPATTYSIKVDCYYNGVAYPVGPATFKTDAVSPPSGSIAPVVYPTVKDQGSYGNCVAMALSTSMEIIKAKKSGIAENYSVSYIFGSDGESYDWMNFERAVELCEEHGSPRWELAATQFPDSKSKAASRTVFDSACALAKSNARKQSFTGHQNIDFYDCAAVASAIRNYGCFMFNFRIPNNFYDVPSSGVVPQPSGGYSYNNHSIALIGLTSIDGKPHWIAQNSWGDWWGKDGRCYIPYDWGCGVQSPQETGNTDQTCGWTCECYSVWNSNVSSANPAAPINLSGAQDGKNTTATMKWSLPTAGSSVLLYARKKNTTDWWPKPSYGSTFSGTSGQVSFDADTTSYEIVAIAVKGDLLSPQTSPVLVSISLLELWSWLASNGAASKAQTQKAYDAVKNKGPTTDFSYLVWNDLVQKINEAVLAAGKTWDNSLGYGTYSQTRMSASDKALTAKRFNAARHNVGRNYSTGLPTVATGGPAKGEYFITLTSKLNDWISTIGR